VHIPISHTLRHAIFALIATVILTQGASAKQPPTDAAPKIDRSVLTTLTSLYGTTSTLVEHVDLATPFKTASPWTLVVAKEADGRGYDQDPADNTVISLCFVKAGVPDCSEKAVRKQYREHHFDDTKRPFYQFFESKVVYLDAAHTSPLLLLRTCTYGGVNGNCGKATLLYRYDRSTDDFRLVFFGITGRNNNQETRFVEKGPLMGSVIVAYPTTDAPYTYYVEVYRWRGAESYRQVLRYRGKTGYRDGNGLPVIDSEMPQILQHLGMWKPGDAPPSPDDTPTGCTRLFMRGGTEWCD
jgi:hypothetical protein